MSPTPPLTYLERYRNEGTRTYSELASFTECRPEYQPTIGASYFDVPAWELPRDALNIYQADPPTDLLARYVPDDRALFVVHPQVVRDAASDPWFERTTALGQPAGEIRVTPGASTRTLYVADATPAHALKVHFPFRVSRYGRRMRDEVVAQAIAVSAEIQAWAGGGDSSFAFLREVLGVTHPRSGSAEGRGENWGYLLRDLRPYPHVVADRPLIPGFALYGRDRFDPSIEPLVFDLAPSSDPLGWALEHVMLPIVRQWVACFVDLGFILEPHGQNVLFELGVGGAFERVVHRDLSVGIDMRRRRDVGLSNERLNDYNRFEDGVFASIAYDRFVGGHFFSYLAKTLIERHPGLTLEDFQGPCVEEFETRFADHARYLPRSVHYFAEERDEHGKPRYADTGAPPSWRP